MNSSAPSKKMRANKTVDNNVGEFRREIYQKTIEHINKAREAGFYLEVVTLSESLIADRLESRISILLNKDYGFKNLGVLIKTIITYETDEELKKLVETELEEWRKLRNMVIHEMVKIEVGNTSSWDDRCVELPEVANKGFNLFRKIDKRIQTLQRER